MAKPVVDGIEKKMEGRLTVARVDVGEDSGSAIARQFGISSIPAFVVLDGAGQVIYRKIGGRPDANSIDAALSAIGK